MKQAHDHDQRELAAGELEKNLVVLAGAGTGKTTLLIDRLTLLILGMEIPVDKIVALTFTQKAAEEMRERLENRLRAVIAGTVEVELLERRFGANKLRWPELAQKALDDIPKSQIGTIHSFAGHLLRLYPLQAGVDPKFREDAGMIAENLFETMWTDWVHTELAADARNADMWSKLLQVLQLSELRELAEALVGPMTDLTALKKAPDLSAFFDQELARLATLRRTYPDPKKTRVFIPALDAAAQIFTNLRNRKPVSEELLDLIDPLDKPPADWAEAKPVLKQLKKTATAFAFVNATLLERVCDLMLPFVSSIRRELARTGAVSFEGLLVFARNLVRDHLDVRESLKNRFATFLIDEFQDTDPLQGEILFYLAERPGTSAASWQTVELEPGRLFVVGDPKQSIYRFRGADIAAFEAFEERMLAQGAIKAALSANFRSDPRILGFVNAVFPRVMQEKKYLQPPYAALEPGVDGPASDRPAVRIVRIQGEDRTLNAEERRLVEAQTTALWIREQVASGLKYSNVAVLLRSSYAFEEYLAAFRSYGIPYLAEGEKSFYRTNEVVDFLNLLSVVANPNDTLAWVGVLRSPVGGLTDKEILDLKRGGWVPNKKIRPLFETLRSLSVEAASLPVADVIKRVLSKTWMLELASTSAHGEQAVANLLKVGRLAETWNEQVPMTLKDFVRRFDRYREDERDEGENPLADVKYDAVKVLTVHKAKGLEFPVVILPNLSSGNRNGADKRTLRRDWRTGLVGLRLGVCGATNAAMALIEREEVERELAEEVRVFYVAATRAKSQMVCLVAADAKRDGRFAEIVVGAGELPGVVYDDVREAPLAALNFAKPSIELGSSWNVDTLSANFVRRESEWKRVGNARLLVSPTSLLAEPEKIRFIDDDVAELSRDRAIKVGHICHKVLEEWDFKIASANVKPALRKALDRAARLFELIQDSEESDVVLSDAKKVLAGFFESESYKELTKVKIVGREIPFLYPTESGSAAAMRGVIDLLVERDGRLVVIDYKTNKIDRRSLTDLADHYRAQGLAYQQAVLRSLGQEADFELLFLRGPISVSVTSLPTLASRGSQGPAVR